jgi:hypothetical protein
VCGRTITRIEYQVARRASRQDKEEQTKVTVARFLNMWSKADSATRDLFLAPACRSTSLTSRAWRPACSLFTPSISSTADIPCSDCSITYNINFFSFLLYMIIVV